MNKYRPFAALAACLLASHVSANTFTVINTNETGSGSLPSAIGNCNNNPGDDVVTFDIPGNGSHTIALTGAMPSITSNITFLNDRPGDGVIIIQGPASPRIRIFSVGPGTTVTFAGLTLTNGSSAIAMDNASVTVRNCYVTGHTSSAIVGNAFSSGIATLTVINSTFWNNSGGSGGAISLGTNTGGVVHATVTNSTFDSNSATSNFNPGSAINIVDNSNSASTLLLVNSTLAFNSSPSGGATVSTDRATVQTLNSIFVHSGSAGNFIVSGGSLVSLGHNLSDLPEGGDLGTGPGGFFNATGDKRNTNPQLGALQSYGGLTLTRAVAAGTPPADAGDDAVLSPPYSLTTDQRGAPRKSGAHIDIGAFEREVLPQSGPGFVVTTTADRDDGVCGAVDCTLREAINLANLNADANTITFVPGLTGTIQQRVAGGLLIAHPLTIAGPGALSLVLDGAQANRFFLIQAGAGNVSILDLTMVRGLASSNTFPNNCGGAIYNASALTLTRCRLISTAASLLGGAIYNDGQNGDASLTTIDSSITDCSAQASGGAIFNAGYTGHATASLTNCTLDGNVATQYGGAIYNDGTVNGNAALTLTNCTISNNRSNAGVGGNINNDGMNPDSSGIATILLRNNIFKRSTAANTGVNLFNDGGTFTSQGHNLSDDPAGGDGSTAPGGYLNAAGDKRNTDPLLTGARDTNGGSTYCMPLSAGSPAINAGDDTYAPAHDQRYFLRNGVSDIGAYEFNGTLGPVSVVSRKMHSGLGPFDVTLPVTGPAGVEPRNIGSGHQLVVIFPTTVTFSSASVTAGNAVLGSVTGSGTSTATINLTSAPDQQLVTLTLFNANDGVTTNNIPLRIGLLLGDANGDGVVNSADATIARNASGQVANASNFRADFNLDGAINSADATTARNNSGHSTPLGTTPEQIGKASDAPYQTEVPLPTPAQADEF